jgi:flagellar protein FliO/FliZ
MIRIRLALLALCPLAANAFAVTATSSPTPGPTAGSMLQVLTGLIAVLGLLAAGAWLLRRVNISKGSSGANIKIVGGVSVGTRERVLVVEVAGQWIVVGVAPGRVNALASLPKQDMSATAAAATTAATIATADAPPARNFSSWLAHIIEKRNGQ